MNQQDFENAFIAKLSGIVEYKNKNEIWWEDNEHKVTIEFLNDSASFTKVRTYYDNGNIQWEKNYQNDKQHGEYIEWYENGNKNLEENYQNDKLYGKSISWFKDGNKQWERNYQNSKLHGKCIRWSNNGNKEYEVDFKNGIKV